MNKLEKGLFENLTQNSGFYIKDYYSEYLNSSKWMAILENNDFVYAVIVCKYNDCDFEYEEAKVFLEKNYFKKISLNVVIYATKEAESFINKGFNKIIYSKDKKQVVYSDNSCKPLVYIIDSLTKNNKKTKYKDSLITNILIGINVLMYLITALVSKNLLDINSLTLLSFGAKLNVLIDRGQVWRLLTCAFLHGGLLHITFNMYALKIIGAEVEYAFGKVKYIIIYLISAIGSSMFNPASISVGASGAIFGLFGAMIIFGIRNKNKIGKEYIINLAQVVIVNIIIGIILSNIDNSAHMGGLVFGAISALILKSKKNILNRGVL